MNENDQLFECPNCGQVFDIGEAEPGRDWTCPACGRTFVVEETDDGPREENGERGAAAAAREEKTPVIESPAASDRRNRAPSFREKSEGRLRVAGTWSVRALRHAGDAFLRLPKWARGAAAASIILLAGIAVCSGRSSAEDVASREDRAAAPPENRAAPPENRAAPPENRAAPPKKILSESAKRQMAIAIAAPMTSSIMRKRIADCVQSEVEKKVRRRRTAFTADEKKEVQELIDFTYAGMMVSIWPRIDLSACPQEFRDEWKRVVDHFSKNSAARFAVDMRKLLEATGTVDLEWWRRTKEDIRRKSGSYPSYRSDEELVAEMSKMILMSIHDVANESDFREIVAATATPDIVDAAHKALCAAGEILKVSSGETTQSRNANGNGSATPEELCEEFASGGSHFVRKSATTVWWDVGGETPRFTCEVSFLPGGTARLTQDNTFYAYEEKNRSTSPQILARRLQSAYSQYSSNSEIRNVKAVATSDGRLLFSGEIAVERGNVSKQIGKVFDALNEARLASRWN